MDTEIEESFNFLLGRGHGKYLDLNDHNKKIIEKYDSSEKADFNTYIINICTHTVTDLLSHYTNPPAVHIAFIDNPKLGAVVIFDKQTDAYFIGLYFGSVEVLTTFFNILVSSPNVLPSLGDTTMAKPIKLNNPFLTDSTDALKYLDTLSGKKAIPNDSMRSEAAQYMVVCAIQFLTLHELGHITNGHITYQLSGNRTSDLDSMFVDSVDEARNEKQKNLKNQGLEFDADLFAAARGLVISYQIAYTSNSKERQQAIEVWTLSVYSLFKLLSSKRSSVTDFANCTHPPAGMRMNMLLNSVGWQLVNIGKDIFDKEVTKEEISNILNNCISQVNAGINDICNNYRLTLKNYSIMFLAELEAVHTQKIVDSFNEIREDVRKFGLAPANP